MNDKQVDALLALLKALYPRQVVEEETVRAYAVLLADLPVAVVQRAVKAHATESPYFPTIAEIRTRAAEEAAGLPTPEEAWSMVAALIPHAQGRLQFDPYPAVPHPVVKKAVDDIGWAELAHGKNPAATRAQFLEQYRYHRAQALRPYLHGTVVPPSLTATTRAAQTVLFDVPANRPELPALTPEEREANLRRFARMVRELMREPGPRREGAAPTVPRADAQ